MNASTKTLELGSEYYLLKNEKDVLLQRLTKINAKMKGIKNECEAIQLAEIEKDNHVEVALYI